MSKTMEQWNRFAVKHGPKSGAFLQSWEWGEFQETCRRNVYRFLITPAGLTQIDAEIDAEKRGNIIGVTQVIKMPLPLGKSYLYIPRGPIFTKYESVRIYEFFETLKELAKKERVIFAKIELPIEKDSINQGLLQTTNYKLQTTFVQPRDTLILDLSKSEDELLAAMHEKTRYNIRLAERKGVEVRWSREETLEKDIDIFWKLAEKTATRDKFSYHPKSYYQSMLHSLSERLQATSYKLQARLVIAEKDGEPLGANIITFFGNTATYLHGASNHEYRELMAPHLLQWRAIQEAKKLGYGYYDFWGITPPNHVIARPEAVAIQSANDEIAARPPVARNDNSHPWSGITRFKLGFGGEQVHYAPTLDLPVSKFWYKIYTLGKKLL